jgi:hypothetical protein
MIETRDRVQHNQALVSFGVGRQVIRSQSEKVLTLRSESFHLLWGDVESMSSLTDISETEGEVDSEAEVRAAGSTDVIRPRNRKHSAWLRNTRKLALRSINPGDITFIDESDDSAVSDQAGCPFRHIVSGRSIKTQDFAPFVDCQRPSSSSKLPFGFWSPQEDDNDYAFSEEDDIDHELYEEHSRGEGSDFTRTKWRPFKARRKRFKKHLARLLTEVENDPSFDIYDIPSLNLPSFMYSHAPMMAKIRSVLEERIQVVRSLRAPGQHAGRA